MDPTARTDIKDGAYKAVSAKNSKGKETSIQLKDNSSESQTSAFGMNSGHGGGSMTARSEGGMVLPLKLEKFLAPSVNTGVGKGNLFNQKDSLGQNTSISDAILSLREDEIENKE